MDAASAPPITPSEMPIGKCPPQRALSSDIRKPTKINTTASP
jgi:hypothetical protein